MLTGYWIENKKIYGPGGYTRAWIDNGHIYTAGSEYPVYWIQDGRIQSTVAGDTGFWIENDFIYGPDEPLPWLAGK